MSDQIQLLVGPALGSAVRASFTSATQLRRRVIIVAFVGDDPLALLDDVRDVEVYCWPKGNSTSERGVRRLIKAGAVVRFCDDLHMKVYWVDEGRAVIGSPNLSHNGLGGGLQEAALSVPSSEVDINQLVASLRWRAVTEGELRNLRRQNAAHRAAGGNFDDRPRATPPGFLAWFESKDRPPFKLGWYEDEIDPPAAMTAAVAAAHPSGDADDFLNSQAANTYKAGDWILYLRTKRGGRTPRDNPKLTWMLVKDVVPLSKAQAREADDERFRYYAYQLDEESAVPPFKLDKPTREAIARAYAKHARAWGEGKLPEEQYLAAPPQAFLDDIFQRLGGRN